MTVATLGIKVPTGPIQKGVTKLDDLSGAARRAERSAAGMGTTASGAARKVQVENQRAARSAQQLEKSYSRIPGAIKLVTAAIFTLGGAFVSIRKFVDNTVVAESALRQLESALASTGGVSGQTTKSLLDMAASLQDVTTYGDETINAAQGILLTFTKIGGDTFPKATEAVLNVATAMKTDLKSAAIQVGKALNDPKTGMDALTRSGITFSDDQKFVIKQLTETGQVAKAQALILKELETQFGGSARAARQTLGGALTSLSNAWGDLFEVSSGASNNLRMSIEGLIDAIRRPEFTAFVEMVGVSLFNALTIAARAVGMIVDHLGDMFDILKVIVAAKTVVWIATLSASFLNLALIIRKVGIVTALFSRIGKVNIVMMAALSAIIAKATGHYEGFEKALTGIFTAAKNLLPEEIANGIDATIASLTSFDFESDKLADNLVMLQNNADGLADSFVGAAAAAKKATEDSKEATKNAAAAAKLAAKQLEDGVEFTKQVAGGFIQDLKSNLEEGKGVWASFAEAALSALDKISNRLLDSALDGLFGGGGAGSGIGGLLSGLFGGSSGAASAASGVTLGSVYHAGGVAGQSGGASRAVASSVFNNAPRYHGGGVAGLKPNEVPAILERGERIIPNGASAGGASAMHITLGVSIDEEGTIKPFVESVSANVSATVVQQATPGIVKQSARTVGAEIGGGSYDKQMGRYNARAGAIPR